MSILVDLTVSSLLLHFTAASSTFTFFDLS